MLVKALPLNEADVQRIIEEICNIPLEDNVSFQIKSTRTIMEEFDYPGIRVSWKLRWTECVNQLKSIFLQMM